MKNKGITLIALVITIIVLLILAGVSIATLTGENGILSQATKAREENEQSEENEITRLAQIEANMNMEENEYNGITIPSGMAPTRKKGESTIDEGIVVVDKNGNEWVWIEVPKTEQIYQKTGINIKEFSENDCINIYDDLKEYVKDYTVPSFTDTWYSEEQHGFKTEEEYNKFKNDVMKSIYENEGFFVGRYEVGTDKGRNSTDDISSFKPMIKKGIYPYNWITCKQSQELAKQFSVGEKKGSMLFGVQWYLMMKYIEEKEAKTQSELKENSVSWGNYANATFPVLKGYYAIRNKETSELGVWNEIPDNFIKPDSGEENLILLSTGASDRNSVLNIYDLAGNLWEWTLERYGSTYNPCACKSGGFTTIDGKTVVWNATITTYSDNHFGFRACLY